MRRLALIAAILVAACSPEKNPDAQPTAAAQVSAPVPAGAPVILAFGDSLYAGYRLNPGEGYPPRLEAALNAAGTPARVVNAGVSGDTTAAALQRLAFTLDNQPAKPVLALVGLGGNDMLRGLPPEQTRDNLDAILTEFDKRGIPVVLTGMLAAPNLGADYARKFNPIWPELAKKHKAALVPFFLQPVIGNKALMLDDNIHPNAQGVDRIVAATQAQVADALEAAIKP
ncbi:lipolytic enzyme, G-D-S-L [Novosphingobium aromaticivorans DSM 12444]|uniref:Lipolytic enzyme, G-D-S-L n=1 Tax=Novosphingobium aromaticivorans (strain ATCC 700278 / DSM 12444 / CCUG 56034 / CIP 105152 / NBRC 16084 / F199) TaxID=279238 RepID=Q2G976_NOVAD|nr:arylesterase [Novosphingobium aromaticivorans]ABD25597.1 lipolytic enzyme, G-D-S-L [Novosphingobium aromaticivorans DSM 12444]SCX98133.1 acyl-CoA thioesterase-1 [Novosphingobium aromaticivorans]